MADNENHPPEQDKPDKKLRLDLSEAIPNGFDEDDDEIIELKDEVSSPPQQVEADFDLNAQFDEDDAASELPPVEKIIDLNDLEDDDGDSENIMRLSDDLAFEEEDDFTDEIPPVEKEPVLKADGHDEVVEVTEFDDILSADTNEMVTLSEISEELEREEREIEDDVDEFLELIEVDEDSETELEEIEEDIIQFDDPGNDIEDVELKDFISDSLDEEIRIDDDFVNPPGVDAGEKMNLAEQASTEEEFDFSMDSSEISKKIDQLDTIFFDDTEEEAKFDENAMFDEEGVGAPEPEISDNDAEIETEDIGSSGDEIETENVGDSGGASIDVPLAGSGIAALDASYDQIEESIERIIEQRFSGKIESMITQIIEKAVSAEIKRLKRILLKDDQDEDL